MELWVLKLKKNWNYKIGFFNNKTDAIEQFSQAT